MKTGNYLIKGCDVFAPEFLGKNDMLLCGGRICGISPRIVVSGLDVIELNGKGLKALPGMVDGHVHIAGAGGEGGPETRTPEVSFQEMIEAGVTTVIGCQGMDGITRSLISLLMKAKGLRHQGLSSWIYTGSYQIPTPTITGDVDRDIALLEEIIGVGEVAIADHRSSSPTVLELIKLAKKTRNGGMLGKKAGLVHLHMGDSPHPFSLIEEAVAQSELNWKTFYPTHCNRNTEIHEACKTYGKKGWVDITTSSYPYFQDIEVKPSRAVLDLLGAGVPLAHITMSSDGGGSLPAFSAEGNCTHLEVGRVDATWRECWDLVDAGLDLSQAWKTVSENPARILKLPGKGRLQTGFDADILLVDGHELMAVFASGRLLKNRLVSS